MSCVENDVKKSKRENDSTNSALLVHYDYVFHSSREPGNFSFVIPCAGHHSDA